MRAEYKLSHTLLTGFAIGLVGTAGFGIAHAFLIEPIWQRLLGGLPFAVFGGCAIAFAFQELRSAGRVTLTARGGILFGLLLWLMLFPLTIFAAGLRLSGSRERWGDCEVVVEVILAFVTGAALGWLLTKRWRVTLALGIAVLALALTMGGPIAIANSPRAAYLFLSFLVIYIVVGISLSLMLSALEKRRTGCLIEAAKKQFRKGSQKRSTAS
jgi:hypothetical protein